MANRTDKGRRRDVRDPKSTIYNPKEFRRSNQRNEDKPWHWTLQLLAWAAAAAALGWLYRIAGG